MYKLPGLGLILSVFYVLSHLGITYSAYSQFEEAAPWEVEVIPKTINKKPNRSKLVIVEDTRIESVTIYVDSFCSDCKKVTEFLTERGVKFTKEQLYLTLTGIPTTILSSEKPPITIVNYSDGTRRRIVGFDESILRITFAGRGGGSDFDDFSLSDFDLRGIESNTNKRITTNPNKKMNKDSLGDSFDLR